MNKFKKVFIGGLSLGLIFTNVGSPISVQAQEQYFSEELRRMFIDDVVEVLEQEDAEEIIEDEKSSTREQYIETLNVVNNPNLIRNGDFELKQPVPTDPHHAGPATFHDAGLWRDRDEMPQDWLFQKWRVDADSDKFKAYYITEDDNSYVRIDMREKPAGTLSFFKSKSVPVQPNTQYIWSADIKKVETNGRLMVRIPRGDSGNQEFFFTGVDDDFEMHYGIFNSEKAKSMGLIFGYEDHNSGEYLIDNASLKVYDGYPLRITMDEEELVLKQGRTSNIHVNYAPVETTKFDLIWTSEDESIATVDEFGTVSAKSVGETDIVATSPVDNKVMAKRKVRVHNDDIFISEITISNLDDSLNTEEKRFLKAEALPLDTTEDLDLTWESSDNSVASIEGNKLTALKAGTVTITAKHKDGTISDSKTITIENRVYDDFAIMRDRWIDILIGTEETMDLNDVDIKSYVDALNIDANELYESMNKESDRLVMANPEVWESVDVTNEAHLTTQFAKLYTLSQAFMTEGTTLYQNEQLFDEILSAFEFIIDVKQYNGDHVSGNWWDWQIVFLNVLLNLY